MLTATQLRGLRPHESLILAVLCDLDWRRINPDCSDDDASLFERFSTQHSLSLFDLQTLLSTLFPYVDNNIQQCGSAFSTLNYSYFTSANRTRFGNTSLVCMCDNESYALTQECESMLHHATFRTFFTDTIEASLFNALALSREARKRRIMPDHGFIYGEKYSLPMSCDCARGRMSRFRRMWADISLTPTRILCRSSLNMRQASMGSFLESWRN